MKRVIRVKTESKAKKLVWVRYGYGMGILDRKKLGALENQGLRKCGKQDLNLQVRIAHMNLNHARLPIPPFPHGMCGQGWIRTTEACRGRFTVCSLWPLGNLPICNSLLTQRVELAMGLEPATC